MEKSQTKTAWRDWLQSNSPRVTYTHAENFCFQLEYEGKAGVKSGSNFHLNFTWWPHQSCMINSARLVLVELKAKWGDRGLLFWYRITLFLRESCKGRERDIIPLFPANLGCLQGTGWNISGFALEIPAVNVALAHPETPTSQLLRPQGFPFMFKFKNEECSSVPP